MKHAHCVKYFQIGCFVFLMLTALSACGGESPVPVASEPEQESAAEQATVTAYGSEELPETSETDACNTLTMEDLVGRWSLTAYEFDGYFEKMSEDGLENSFTFVRHDDGSISAFHIEEYPYGGMTEITDAPVECVETYSDYLLFRQYDIPWFGELDMTGQPMSDASAVWERYCVGLIDENALLVHYTAEITAEPYMVGIVYYYGKVNPTGSEG